MRLFKGKNSEKCYGLTNVGKVRTGNEDYIFYSCKDYYYILADGMGGHNAGEIASKESVLYIKNNLRLQSLFKSEQDIGTSMSELFLGAHQHLIDLARKNPDYRGMGCTLCLVVLEGMIMHACHVGDSRIYVIDQTKIGQIGTDHSVVAQAVKNGHMTPEEAKESTIRNKLTMAIGAPVEVVPEYTTRELKEDEIILVCSDGLWDMVSDEEIHRITLSGINAEKIADGLLQAALNAGGSDNISIIVIKP